MPALSNTRPTTLAEPNYRLMCNEAKKRGCLDSILRLMSIIQSGSFLNRKAPHKWGAFVGEAESELEACLKLWKLAEVNVSSSAQLGHVGLSDDEMLALGEQGIVQGQFVKVCRTMDSHRRWQPCEPDATPWETVRLCLLAGMLDMVFARVPGRHPTYQNVDGHRCSLPREAVAHPAHLLLGVPMQLQPLEAGGVGKKILAFAVPMSIDDIEKLLPTALSLEMGPPEFDPRTNGVASRLGHVFKIGSRGGFVVAEEYEAQPKAERDPRVCAPVLAAAICDGKWNAGREIVEANADQIEVANLANRAYSVGLGIRDEDSLRSFYERALTRMKITSLDEISKRSQFRLPTFSTEMARKAIDAGMPRSMLLPHVDLEELIRFENAERDAARLAAKALAEAAELARCQALEAEAPELRRALNFHITTSAVFDGTSVTVPENISAVELSSSTGAIITEDSEEVSKLCRKPGIGYPNAWKEGNTHGRRCVLGVLPLAKGGSLRICAEQHGGKIVVVAYWLR